jgi:hypothetical protein
MAILASMFGYLSALSGILIALITSFYLVFGAVDHPVAANQAVAITTKLNAYKPTAARMARSGQWGPSVIHRAPEGAVAPQIRTAANTRRKPRMAIIVPTRQPGIERQGGVPGLAYQPDARVEPRAFGYTGETSFQYDRHR